MTKSTSSCATSPTLRPTPTLGSAQPTPPVKVGLLLILVGKSNRKLPANRNRQKENVLAHDVGPVLRQLFTGAQGFFEILFFLTLDDTLPRGQVPEGAVRPRRP